MKNMKAPVGLIALFAGLSAVAVPMISSDPGVTLTQRGRRLAEVTYTLSGGPAIVTVDFCTNGVSIGACNVTSLAGDVNKLVSDGAHKLTWNVFADWPGHTITNGSLTAVVTAWSPSCPPPYMALDLSGAKGTFYYPCAEAVPGGVTNDLYKTDKLLMRKIEACNRTFRMGSSPNEAGYSTTQRARLVTLTKDFWIGIYPVTQRQQFLAIGNLAQCSFTDKEDSNLRPANGCSNKNVRNNTSVSGNPGNGSILTALRAVTGEPLDVPTEAQWEFACRAGTGTYLYSGANLEDKNAATSERLGKLAWYAGNAGGETHPVGLKEPNAFGLYDMIGNVSELVLDQYNDIATNDQVTDPLPTNGNGQIFRGGSYASQLLQCSPAHRWTGAPISWSSVSPERGFRCALTIQ